MERKLAWAYIGFVAIICAGLVAVGFYGMGGYKACFLAIGVSLFVGGLLWSIRTLSR